MIPILCTAIRIKILQQQLLGQVELMEACCTLDVTHSETQELISSSDIDPSKLPIWNSEVPIDEDSLSSSLNNEVARLTNRLLDMVIQENSVNLLDAPLEVTYENLLVDDIREFDNSEVESNNVVFNEALR